MPTAIALPIPPIAWAKAAAKHPNPPPSIVPIPRFKPLLSVAPDRYNYYQIIMKHKSEQNSVKSCNISWKN